MSFGFGAFGEFAFGDVGRDIAFDAATNSGYKTATASYSWSHTCTGIDRYLTVGIPMLSVGGSSVSGITYNGVALALLKSQASAAGAVRVEIWGLAAPATGSNLIAVTLSAALDSIGCAVSHTNVTQSSSTEGANSASATNVGAADATVNVTTVADNDVCVDVVAADDTAITAGANQTSRSNVTGALGSGGMSTEGPKYPAGSVTMSWTDVGALATWSIASVALKPASVITQYSLTAAAGAYAFTGNAAGLAAARRLAAVAGSYVFTGVTARLERLARITAAVGSYSFSGQAAGVKATRRLAAAAGAYSFSGQAATIGAQRRVAAAAGAYAFTGNAAAITAVRRVTAAVGSYSFGGQAARLAATRRMDAAPGHYTFLGSAAGLPVTMPAQAGIYLFTGVDAGLIFSHLDAGAYVFDGKAAALRADRKLYANYCVYTFTFNDLAVPIPPTARRPLLSKRGGQSSYWRGREA